MGLKSTYSCILGSTFSMDSMKGQGGIQMLLTAEQEARQIISNAKNLKLTRLKQAKEEAEREVKLYHSNMEAAYQKKISETSGSSGSNVKRLDEETAMRIQSLKESASRVSSDVVAMLIKHVTAVEA
ncbi:V-type proton ATPase subunit G 1-like isoform X1 [Vitis riparia]|uniref:V-type proton ATPase subunit G 1-like isoform X1 n=2 Tax=Vitis riparia TaxID=96939 RepID=UPI00155A1E00|nr:V-type proton ATPase subunit G 1-like isoform X1 [Vitis riparia]XP_034677455.1 V-type proton ATPase subunit G 1-like isoform X1 [Vitis riparia]XP_034677456.1 V-type proton ATPase subunit G 1-like isoform X1 [Vitis riparia]